MFSKAVRAPCVPLFWILSAVRVFGCLHAWHSTMLTTWMGNTHCLHAWHSTLLTTWMGNTHCLHAWHSTMLTTWMGNTHCGTETAHQQDTTPTPLHGTQVHLFLSKKAMQACAYCVKGVQFDARAVRRVVQRAGLVRGLFPV